MFASAVLSLTLAAAPVTVHRVDDRVVRATWASDALRTSAGARRVEVQREAVRVPGRAVALVPGSGEHFGEALAVVCEATSRTDEARPCPLFRIDALGRAVSLDVEGLWGAQLAGDAFVYWTAAMELRVREPRAHRDRLLARGAVDPALSADGARVGFGRVPGLTRFALGVDPCPAVVAVRGGEPRVLAGACAAQGPFVGPGGAALFVSTTTGLASFFVHQGAGPSAQVTNLGRTDAGEGFVPVAGRELVWLDARTAAYEARYETSTIWTLDVRTGRAVKVGEGSSPALVRAPDGGLRAVALSQDGGGLVVGAGGVQ